MTGLNLLAALSAALFVCVVVAAVVPPRRRLAGRVEPYVALGRSRLGTGAHTRAIGRLVPIDERSTLSRIFGPTIESATERLGRWVDVADHDTAALRLRHAGHSDPDVAQYRMRQLASTVLGGVVGVALGMHLFDRAPGAWMLVVCFALAGATHRRGQLDRRIEQRRRAMRAEVPTLAQLLAVHLRTGHGPVEAVRHVSARSHGPVAGELREALSVISGGLAPQVAYEQLAESTPEPTAARLHRLLASSVRSGGDIVEPLLAISNEIRAEQRDSLARASTRRRTAMVVPLLLLVAPVMTLFVAAALPTLVFGGR